MESRPAFLAILLLGAIGLPCCSALAQDLDDQGRVLRGEPFVSKEAYEILERFAAGEGDTLGNGTLTVNDEYVWLWLPLPADIADPVLHFKSPYLHTFELYLPDSATRIHLGGSAWPDSANAFVHPEQFVILPANADAILARLYTPTRVVVPVDILSSQEAQRLASGKLISDGILIGLFALSIVFCFTFSALSRDVIFGKLTVALTCWMLTVVSILGYDTLYIWPAENPGVTSPLFLLAIGAHAWFYGALQATGPSLPAALYGLRALALAAPMAILLRPLIHTQITSVYLMYVLGALVISSAVYAAWRGDLAARFVVISTVLLVGPQPFISLYGYSTGYLTLAACGSLVFMIMAVLQRFNERIREAEATIHKASAQKHFVATMSHEIRTPLNAIIGYVQLARMQLSDPNLEEQLQQVDDASQLLLTIVNDLLDLSKLDEQALQLERIPVNLKGMLERPFNLFRDQAERKNISLLMSIDDACPDNIVADPTRCSQIVLNLLSNALKFTDRGEVRLEVSRVTAPRDELRINVSDTGIGIPAEALGNIFNAFSQADVSTSRHFGGTGLGLAICTQLARLMDGEVQVESTLGQGSRFTLCIPCEEASEALADTKAAEDPNLSAELTGLTVLLAEDNPVNQMVAKRILENFGINVSVAGNGEEAISRFTQDNPDLVLMDMQMPKTDGLEATSRIRDIQTHHVPIIALTANASSEDRSACEEAGMDDFLAKPLDATVLLNRIVYWPQQNQQRGKPGAEAAPSLRGEH